MNTTESHESHLLSGLDKVMPKSSGYYRNTFIGVTSQQCTLWEKLSYVQ